MLDQFIGERLSLHSSTVRGRGFTHALFATTALGCAAAPALAFAQSDPAPAEAASRPAAESDGTIVVTAQRREERLEDIPMTVGYANAAVLEAAGVDSLRDINRVVSGVMLNQSGAFPAPTIRGVTSLTNGNSFENNVAVYVDGFYEPAAQALNIDLPNVQNIQVLKGPQGTLYGRNATGGAILLQTIQPGNEWHGKAEVTYARFDDKRASGYVAGPLSDMIGVSLAGYVRRSDGYVKLTSRTTPGKLDGNAAPLEQDSVRAKIRFAPTSNFTATAAYNYTHISDARGNMFSVFENVPTSLAAVTTRPTVLGTAAYDHGAIVETRSHQGTLTLEWDTGVGDLKSYTGYQTLKSTTAFDFDGSYVDSAWSSTEFRQNTFQQAIDFTADTIGDFDVSVGGNYFRDSLRTIPGALSMNYQGLVTTPSLTPPPFSNLVPISETLFRQRKNAWGLYVDATWHVTDKLHFNLGGRYSHEKQDVFGQALCFITSVTAARNVCRAIVPDANGDRYVFPATNKSSSYSKFTPRASLRYEFGPRTNVYASYSQGFRSGAWNASLPLLQVNPVTCPASPGAVTQGCGTLSGPADWQDAKQESVTAYEIGFKTVGSGFRFEASAFLYNYKNLQVSVTQCVGGPPCTTQTVVTNAPRAQVKGFEASAEYSAIKNLNLRANFTYLHARYGDGFEFNFTGVGTTAGIPVSADPLKNLLNVTQLQNLSGLQMSRAPDFTGSISATYDVPIGNDTLQLSGNLFYTSKFVVTNPSVWGNAASVPVERQREHRFVENAYILVSASMIYTMVNGAYLRLWGKNLTDKQYRLHYTGTAGGTYAPMAEPRTYGATLGFRF